METDGTSNQRGFFSPEALESILAETGLEIGSDMVLDEVRDSLEEIANEYHWKSMFSPVRSSRETAIPFNALATASVTPSRLRDRLFGIQQSAKRVFAGTSRRPKFEKVAELLERLGYDSRGNRLRFSGAETPGHGGSESSAVRLSLIRAVAACERPAQGYRSRIGERPWASQKLDEAIGALVAAVQDPEQRMDLADNAAQSFHRWVQWIVPFVDVAIAPSMARHHGDEPLDNTMKRLAEVYQNIFGKNPSLYKSDESISRGQNSPWIIFVRGVLTQIMRPDDPPSPSALSSRWRQLLYAKR